VAADGSIYTGEFKGGKKSGKGTMWVVLALSVFLPSYLSWWFSYLVMDGVRFWKDHSKYEGEFENDLQHGEGVMTYNDGRKVTGTWRDGRHVEDAESIR